MNKWNDIINIYEIWKWLRKCLLIMYEEEDMDINIEERNDWND